MISDSAHRRRKFRRSRTRSAITLPCPPGRSGSSRFQVLASASDIRRRLRRQCSIGGIAFGCGIPSADPRAPAEPRMRERHDTVVIGGGQAGLAMSYLLQQRGRENIVLERRRVGERWRTQRWDSLRFQFPNWSLQLPGYTYTGDDPEGFTHYREILRLIADYSASTGLPSGSTPKSSASPRTATEASSCPWLTMSIHARRVVVATGPFQRPLIPPLSREVSPSVLQTDPTRYRCPGELPAGAVLVVGSGASGCQIADELLDAGRRVYLSVSRHRRTPRRFRGKDVFWWLEKMGRFAQTIDSFPARQWPPSTVITGVNGGYDVNVRQLAADGVTVVGRVVGAAGDKVAIRADANQILDEADTAYIGFLSAAREFVAKGVDDELAEEQPVNPTHLPAAVDEVASLDLTRENITDDHLGDRVRLGLRLGEGPSASTSGAVRSSNAVSPSGQESTFSVCTGCTRSSQACSPGSAATPHTLPTTWHGHPEPAPPRWRQCVSAAGTARRRRNREIRSVCPGAAGVPRRTLPAGRGRPCAYPEARREGCRAGRRDMSLIRIASGRGRLCRGCRRRP